MTDDPYQSPAEETRTHQQQMSTRIGLFAGLAIGLTVLLGMFAALLMMNGPHSTLPVDAIPVPAAGPTSDASVESTVSPESDTAERNE